MACCRSACFRYQSGAWAYSEAVCSSSLWLCHQGGYASKRSRSFTYSAGSGSCPAVVAFTANMAPVSISVCASAPPSALAVASGDSGYLVD